LEVDGLKSLAKVLGTVDDDGSKAQQKNYGDDDSVRASRGWDRAHREAGKVRQPGRGEYRTWAV
jgi:hypothetical protein